MNFVPLLEPGRAEPRMKAYRDRLQKLEGTIKALESKKDPSSSPPPEGAASGVARAQAAVASRRTCRARTRSPKGSRSTSPLQRRGDPANPGQVVPRGVPRFAFLDGEPPPAVASHGSGRLELADWLTQPDNPLTPRVIVNRIWQHHFGRGIVATPSNFGVRGEPPTHPELLDWLAARFVASGWSIKAIQRDDRLVADLPALERSRCARCRDRSRRSLALALPAPAARR